nr:hypothetical protein CFP56_64879 [Quercus suber]
MSISPLSKNKSQMKWRSSHEALGSSSWPLDSRNGPVIQHMESCEEGHNCFNSSMLAVDAIGRLVFRRTSSGRSLTVQRYVCKADIPAVKWYL